MAQHSSSNDDQEKMNNGLQENDRQASHPTPTMVGMARPAWPKPDQQAQKFAERLALVLLAASIMALPFFYFLAARSDAWQLTALFYINIPFVTASAIALWLERRGRVSLSVSLVLVVMGLVVVAASVLISGIGIIAGMAAVTVIMKQGGDE